MKDEGSINPCHRTQLEHGQHGGGSGGKHEVRTQHYQGLVAWTSTRGELVLSSEQLESNFYFCKAPL